MNQDLIAKYRFIIIACSAVILLWYLADVNILNFSLIRDYELKDNRMVVYILIAIILFCIFETIVEHTKNTAKSTQSKVQLTTIILLPSLALLVSYPKIVTDSFLEPTDRIDLLISIIAALATSYFAQHIHYYVTLAYTFYKIRKRLYIEFIFWPLLLLLLISLAIMSLYTFIYNTDEISLLLRSAVFTILFIIFFIYLSPKEPLFPDDKLEDLHSLSESLDRSAEGNNQMVPMPTLNNGNRKKHHKKAMSDIRKRQEREENKVFPRFTLLTKITFEEVKGQLYPYVENTEDEDDVIQVEKINRATKRTEETTYIKLKFVKMVCENLLIPEIKNLDNVEKLINEISISAYQLQMAQERDANELLIEFSYSDESADDLKKLIKTRTVNINHKNPVGWSPLLTAVANGAKDNARYLLQKAADPDLSTKHGATALHFACKYGQLQLCELLIEYQANVNKADVRGVTPLMWAAQLGHSAIVKLLVENGADSALSDKDQMTALTYAEEGKFGEIRTYLIKKAML